MKFAFNKETGTLQPVKNYTFNNEDVNKNYQSEQKENIDGEAIYKFRSVNDLTTYQIIDDVTRKPMMVISGYALKISFNLEELKSTEKIDQLLSGLSDLFRKMILDQALEK